MNTRRIRRNRINENQKVTLTLGQLKRLVKESISDEGDFEIEDGVLVKYHGNGGDVVIPDGVTSIGDYAFDGCSNLTSVTIPDTVTSIGISAFSDCSQLNSVTIGNSVTRIEPYAFYNCFRLKSVTIPDSVKNIGHNAFCACCGLSGTLTIPSSVKKIEYYAFSDCRNLTSVVIQGGMTSIGEEAFTGCRELRTIVISNEKQRKMLDYKTNDVPFAKIIVKGEDSDDGYEVTENESGTIFLNNRIDELKDELNAEFGG